MLFTHLMANPLESEVALENDVKVNESAVDAVAIHLAEAKAVDAEVTVEAAGMAAIISAVATCSSALDVLSANAVHVEDAIKVDAGLTPREAAFLTSSLSQLDAQFGGSAFAIPALENIGGDQARLLQSEIALENMRDKFDAVWKRIVEMLEKLKKAAIEMYRKIFGSFENLKKAADAADKKFGSLGSELKDGDFTVKGLDKVAVAGKANYDAVPAAITSLTRDGKAALDENQRVFQAYADAVAEHVGADIDDAKLKAASAKVATALEGLAKVSGGKKASLGGKDYNYVDLMGGAGLLATGEEKIDVSGDSGARADAISAGLKALVRKVGPWTAKVDGKADDKVTPWKQAQCINVATEAGKIADYLLDMQKAADAAGKALDDVAKAAKKRGGAKVEEDKKALAKEVQVASSLASKLTSLTTVQLALGNHIASVTRQSLELANKTAAQYK